MINSNCIDIVICSAGKGTRLGLNKPKGLVTVAGKKIIQRQIEFLREVLPNSKIYIVSGYLHEEIESYINSLNISNVQIIFNPIFDCAGIMGSALISSLFVKSENVLRMDGDVLFTDKESFYSLLEQDRTVLCVTSSIRPRTTPVLETLDGMFDHCELRDNYIGDMEWICVELYRNYDYNKIVLNSIEMIKNSYYFEALNKAKKDNLINAGIHFLDYVYEIDNKEDLNFVEKKFYNEYQDYIFDIFNRRATEAIISNSFDSIYNSTAILEGETKHYEEIDFIKRKLLINKDSVVLDLCCGNGRLSEYFSDKCKKTTGIDYSTVFIDRLNSNERENSNYLVVNVLSPFSHKFTHTYSVVLFFGTTQFIISDEDLKMILIESRKLMSHNGLLLIKQTTSVLEDSIFIDKMSSEINSRWIAKYRTISHLQNILTDCGFVLLEVLPAYDPKKIGIYKYKKIERWEDTKQYYFLAKNV